jgi:hypothetical protein
MFTLTLKQETYKRIFLCHNLSLLQEITDPATFSTLQGTRQLLLKMVHIEGTYICVRSQSFVDFLISLGKKKLDSVFCQTEWFRLKSAKLKQSFLS